MAPGDLGQPAHRPALLPRPWVSSPCSGQSFAVRGQKQGKAFTSVTGCPHVCVTARVLLCQGVLTPLSSAPVNTVDSHCPLRHPAAAELRPESPERPSGPRLPCHAQAARWLVAVIGTPLDVPEFHALLGAGDSPLPPRGVQAGPDRHVPWMFRCSSALERRPDTMRLVFVSRPNLPFHQIPLR